VVREIARSEPASAAGVEVEFEDGVVTLSGRVQNGLAARRAVATAGTIRGVREVNDQLTFETPDVPDFVLAENVRTALSLDPAVELQELRVRVTERVVHLEGVVQSFTEKELAAEATWSVRGVRGVENGIVVAPHAMRADVEIRADVVGRLQRDVQLDAEPIEVTVEGGVVRLSGEVGSLYEKRRAATQGWVSGTRHVEVSALHVNPEQHARWQRDSALVVSDRAVEGALRESLELDPRVRPAALDVSAVGGLVTLTGEVSTWLARRSAARVAENTPGVWKVVNQLRVTPALGISDEALRRRVSERLATHPDLDPESVEVQVREGVVVLTGKVDEPRQREQAQGVAEAVPGTVRIDNQLEVRAPLRDDSLIQRDIESSLWWDARVDGSRVEVQVKDGVVTVTGSVRSRAAYDAVLESVLEANARGTVNRLRLNPPQR
jgi:osmotically-inducible protein OsmY